MCEVKQDFFLKPSIKYSKIIMLVIYIQPLRTVTYSLQLQQYK